MNNQGWRKPTPGLGVAEQHAQVGERVSIPKSQAILATKRIAAHLGLKASDVMLLDTLGAFTKPQDWEEGRRPIVWASNAYLMEQTGFSLSALKRHARRLVDFGVISFKDSPNGKRWGHRDKDGYIVEAYGYDLAPLAARAHEFEVLFDHIKAERQLSQRLKRQITIVRRAVRAKIETALSQALSGPWSAFRDVFDTLIRKLPGSPASSEQLLSVLNLFKDLQKRVERYFSAGEIVVDVDNDVETIPNIPVTCHKLNPRGTVIEPHILTTKQPNPVKCNPSETEDAEPTALQTEPQVHVAQEVELGETKPVRPDKTDLDIAVVMQACPEFAEMARNLGGYIKDWNELHRIAGQVRPMVGVSEHAWGVAQEALGPQAAAAAMALIFDKFSDGDVASPGGYLRGIVDKAGVGELYLERSFFGRLSADRASAHA